MPGERRVSMAIRPNPGKVADAKRPRRWPKASDVTE